MFHQVSEEAIRVYYSVIRACPDDLRNKGLVVACHNDYKQDGKDMTFWLMNWIQPGKLTISLKGEGESDAEALDQIRAQFAKLTDNHKHAPGCPANHFHGSRAPTGKCSCGAVKHGIKMLNSPLAEIPVE